MSELMNVNVHVNRTHGDLRLRLLATVSAALSLWPALPQAAMAQDGDRPTVWVELGGQLEHSSDSIEPFAPPFIIENLDRPHNAVSPLSAEQPARFGFGGEGSIMFQPQGSDWAFTAAVRYGRSNRNKHLHQQTTSQAKQYIGTLIKYAPVAHWNEALTSIRETHAVMDFKAGKDVGLGLFGRGSGSKVELGVRYAQFSSNAMTVFRSEPDLAYPTQFFSFAIHHHSYYAHQNISHNFRGVGPSISWDGSSPLVGNADTSELRFDWGVNAAVLFGRQKVSGSHHTSGSYHFGSWNAGAKSAYHTTVPVRRSHSVVIPNVGAMAGLTFQHGPARVGFGYRADFFFGAMDGGIDARKTYDRNFYGPFATISIGLGG